MSKRIDIRGEIHNSLLVLRFIKNQNSHALWKCKCLNCRKAVFVTYSNIMHGNRKACASCAQRVLTATQDKEVSKLYSEEFYTLVQIAEVYNISKDAVKNSLVRAGTAIKKGVKSK